MTNTLEQEFILSMNLTIRAIETAIGEDTAALDGEDDVEHSLLLRARIQARTTALNTMKKARADVVPPMLAFQELEPKFLRWRALDAAAREAQEKAEALAHRLEAARLAVIPFENAAGGAEQALIVHRKFAAELERPGRHSSGSEIASARATTRKLIEQHESALACLREAKQVRDALHGSWYAAAKDAIAAANSERRARLPEPPEPYRSMGSLSPVESGGVARVA